MNLSILLILCVALVGSAAAQTDLPIEIRDCKVAAIWDFNTDGDAQGWLADHNVSPFVIKNGVCSFELTGMDAWIMHHDLDIDASSHRYIGIKMRSNRGAGNQIYFATADSPATGEDKVLSYPISGDGEFGNYEVSTLVQPVRIVLDKIGRAHV